MSEVNKEVVKKEAIKFDFVQSALDPFNVLLDSMSMLKSVTKSDTSFDLLITPVKEKGQPDRLLLEVIKGPAYGVVSIDQGITVHEGANQPVLMSLQIFTSLPVSPVANKPIKFNITDRVYVTYPNDGSTQDTKFDFEYSDKPETFTRTVAAPLSIGYSNEIHSLIETYIDSASNYVFKKRVDEPMSLINISILKDNTFTIEATTGTEAFYAKTKINEIIRVEKDKKKHLDFSCMLYPSLWQAGFGLGTKYTTQVYLGYNDTTITFASNNTAISHPRVSFKEFPKVAEMVSKWLETPEVGSFSAAMNPSEFKKKLVYLESIGLQAKAQEPSFILSKKNDQPHIKLQGFISSGETKIIDKSILSIEWKKEAEIKLPAHLMNTVLTTAETHGLTKFFDLKDIPSVFISNELNDCCILMSQEI